MTGKQSEVDGEHRTSELRSRWERRRFLAIGGGVGATLFAGCTSDSLTGDDPDDGSDDGTDDGSADGTDDGPNFRLLVSDRPADIDDFDSLEVTFDSARVFQGGDDGADDGDEAEDGSEGQDGGDGTGGQGDAQETDTEGESDTETESGQAEDEGETETVTESDQEEDDGSADSEDNGDGGDDESGGESGGFVEFDLDDPTVDLTEVVGEKAMAVTEGHLEEGSYRKMELNVSDVEGIVDGREAEVKVPSEKLQLTKSFEIAAGETVDFVFDINVVKRGNEESYNLKPVVSKSGVVGDDLEEHEEVGDEGDEADETEDEGDDQEETAEDESTETEEDEPTETASD